MSARNNLLITGLLTFTLLVGLVGGYSWYWHSLADSFEAGLALWIDARRAEGFQVQLNISGTTGFPFDVVISVHKPELGRNIIAYKKGWLWKGKRIEARISPTNPQRLHLHLVGPQTLAIVDNNKKQKIHVTASDTRGVVVTDGENQLLDVSANFDTLVLSGTALTGTALINRLEIKLRRRGLESGPEVDLSLKSNSIQLPKGVNRALGDFLDLAHLDVTFFGQLPKAWVASEIGDWRDGGGIAEVTRGRIKWGPLDMVAEGTVTLDSQMRPLMSGTGSFKGYAETISAYKMAGLITPLNAAALTIALNMRRRDATGRITIPITGQNGQLWVGPWAGAQIKPLPLPTR